MADEPLAEGAHLTHCNQGDYAGSCKYGDDVCPAMSNDLTPATCAYCHENSTTRNHDKCANPLTTAGLEALVERGFSANGATDRAELAKDRANWLVLNAFAILAMIRESDERAEREKRLREALEPFAKVADRASKGETDLRDLAWPLLGVFDADDFLRAAAALANTKGQHDD